MRIPVVDGDLQRALKAWERIATENRAALARHRWHVGPSEARKRKDRLAAKRRRRSQSKRTSRRYEWWTEHRP